MSVAFDRLHVEVIAKVDGTSKSNSLSKVI